MRERVSGVPAPARAFAALAVEDDLGTERLSPRRRFSVLLLALGALLSAPLFWSSAALGSGADQPLATVAKSEGHGGDENRRRQLRARWGRRGRRRHWDRRGSRQ